MFNWLKNLLSAGSNKPNLSELLAQDHVILDVRTNEEFKSGHIKGAVHIPLDMIGNNVEKIKKYNKPVIAYCRSGRRSGMACSMMTSAGIICANGGGYEEMRQMVK